MTELQPVKRTAEILAFKVLNRNITEAWVDWALEMLLAGYDTEHLVILAGEREPFNSFQMQVLTDKVLAELHLNYSDKHQVIKNYVCYLIGKSLDGELENFRVLSILKGLCIEIGYQDPLYDYLYDFYSLYFAKEDLLHAEYQYYWGEATKENIDEIITNYFIQWKATECRTNDRVR